MCSLNSTREFLAVTTSEDVPLVEFMCFVVLLACRLRDTVGHSGLCCCVCVTSFERLLSPLCVGTSESASH